MTVRPLAGAAAAVAALGMVAACSSAGPAPGRSGRPSQAEPSSASQAPSTTPAPATSVTPVPGTTAPSATASSAPSSAAGAPGAPGAPTATSSGPRSTCRNLMVRVIRGSAAPGFEFAALQFVNTGTTQCVLYGYPQVRLLRAGAPIGTPATPADATTSRFTLAPGAVAESRLKDYSSCQASLSDEIQVVVPNSSISVTRPGQLRACRLRVSALATPE